MKSRLFYGWYIVAAAMLLAAYQSSLFAYGWSAFVNPLVATFGWSMTETALASSLRGVETGVLNPVWGMAVDRYSARKLMLAGAIVTAIGTYCLSRTTNLATYYIGFLIMGLGGSLIMGVLPVAVIAKWFRKDLGKANGLFYTGIGAGGLLVPVLVKVIDDVGWQTTLLFAAIGFVILGVPLSFVFRSPPKDYGLPPDGKSLDAAKKSRPAQTYDFSIGVKEALKMKAFWCINILALLEVSMTTVLLFYMIPYMTSVGMTRSTAGTVVMLFTVASVAGRLPLGMLADIFKKSYLIALSCGFRGIGFFLFYLLRGDSPFWLILLFAITYGLGLSGSAVLRPPILAEYFGTRKFGTIFGLMSIFTSVGSVIAAPAAGLVFDTYHDYRPVWLALIGFAVLAVILMLIIPPSAKTTKQGTRAPS